MMYFILFLLTLVHASWRFIPETEIYSAGFYSMEYQFICRPVDCYRKWNRHPWKEMRHIIHIGEDHRSNYPLLIYKICSTIQMCVKRKNIKTSIFHNENNTNSHSHYLVQKSSLFLNILDVQFDVIKQAISPPSKLLASLQQLDTVVDVKVYILESEVNEFFNSLSVSNALREMDNGYCEGTRANIVDRVALNGELSTIKVNSKFPLLCQFPNECKISQHLYPERFSNKVVVYNSHYRLSLGQSDIWCNKAITKKKDNSVVVEKDWDGGVACRKHIYSEIHKDHRLFRKIVPLVPKAEIRPRICESYIKVYRYAFIEPFESKSSARNWPILNKEGNICVECSKFACTKEMCVPNLNETLDIGEFENDDLDHTYNRLRSDSI